MDNILSLLDGYTLENADEIAMKLRYTNRYMKIAVIYCDTWVDHMKKTTYLFLMMLCLCITACTTSKTTISQSANLSKYKYATLTDVMNYQGFAALMDAEVKIYDAIDNSRLQMVGDYAVNELTYEQKQQLLMVRFGVTQNDEESIVTVNFVDYFTGRPVASCRGAFGLGLNRQGDFNGAIKKVASQIQHTFPKNQ